MSLSITRKTPGTNGATTTISKPHGGVEVENRLYGGTTSATIEFYTTAREAWLFMPGDECTVKIDNDVQVFSGRCLESKRDLETGAQTVTFQGWWEVLCNTKLVLDPSAGEVVFSDEDGTPVALQLTTVNAILNYVLDFVDDLAYPLTFDNDATATLSTGGKYSIGTGDTCGEVIETLAKALGCVCGVDRNGVLYIKDRQRIIDTNNVLVTVPMAQPVAGFGATGSTVSIPTSGELMCSGYKTDEVVVLARDANGEKGKRTYARRKEYGFLNRDTKYIRVGGHIRGEVARALAVDAMKRNSTIYVADTVADSVDVIVTKRAIDLHDGTLHMTLNGTDITSSVKLCDSLNVTYYANGTIETNLTNASELDNEDVSEAVADVANDEEAEAYNDIDVGNSWIIDLDDTANLNKGFTPSGVDPTTFVEEDIDYGTDEVVGSSGKLYLYPGVILSGNQNGTVNVKRLNGNLQDIEESNSGEESIECKIYPKPTYPNLSFFYAGMPCMVYRTYGTDAFLADCSGQNVLYPGTVTFNADYPSTSGKYSIEFQIHDNDPLILANIEAFGVPSDSTLTDGAKVMAWFQSGVMAHGDVSASNPVLKVFPVSMGGGGGNVSGEGWWRD